MGTGASLPSVDVVGFRFLVDFAASHGGALSRPCRTLPGFRDSKRFPGQGGHGYTPYRTGGGTVPEANRLPRTARKCMTSRPEPGEREDRQEVDDALSHIPEIKEKSCMNMAFRYSVSHT